MKKNIYTNKAPEPIGPYSQGVFVNGTLYCSGQIAMDDLDKDVKIQTEKLCDNIGEILKVANMKFSNVVKTTCFLADMDDFAAFNEVYGKYFDHKPARSCIAVKELPKGALVEVEVIGVE